MVFRPGDQNGAGRPAALDAGRTLLGWETTEQMLGRKFSKVVLMGPYWSGTNAVREEVRWRFHSPVLNPDKLEVTAKTRELVQALQSCVAHGPVLTKPARLGDKEVDVPKGYKLLGGPSTQAILARAPRPCRSSTGNGQGGRPVELEAEEDPSESSVVSEPPSNNCIKPPIAVYFGPDTSGDCDWWKHAVRSESQGPVDTDDDTLVILVTKDPLFWLKSMSKHFYDMKVPEGSQRNGLNSLFGELEHCGRRYRDALEFWCTIMESFLDERRFPKNRCVLLRYEDLLFRFWDVMVHMAAFLPAKEKRLKEPPNSSRSKSHGRAVRGRDEALRFYAWSEKRLCDFTQSHFERFREIPRELLAMLSYDDIPWEFVDTLPSGFLHLGSRAASWRCCGHMVSL